MKIKGKGRDQYGLPSTGSRGQASIRNKAMARYNAEIRRQNRMIERANELRYYKSHGNATPKQLQRLDYLESLGY
jgi:hypothetical protein